MDANPGGFHGSENLVSERIQEPGALFSKRFDGMEIEFLDLLIIDRDKWNKRGMARGSANVAARPSVPGAAFGLNSMAQRRKGRPFRYGEGSVPRAIRNRRFSG
jgi:hypothetical protein